MNSDVNLSSKAHESAWLPTSWPSPAMILRKFFGNFEGGAFLMLLGMPDVGFERSVLLRDFGVVAGLILVLAGFWGRLYTRAAGGRDSGALDGPYRYLRNPDEVFSLIFYAGSFLVMHVNWSWVLASMLCVFVYFAMISSATEKSLRIRLGRHYDRYRKRARRWIPVLYPALNRSYVLWSWKQALKSEWKGWLWIITLGLLAWKKGII